MNIARFILKSRTGVAHIYIYPSTYFSKIFLHKFVYALIFSRINTVTVYLALVLSEKGKKGKQTAQINKINKNL